MRLRHAAATFAVSMLHGHVLAYDTFASAPAEDATYDYVSMTRNSGVHEELCKELRGHVRRVGL